MSVCMCVCRVLDVRCSFSSYMSTCVFFEAHAKGPKKDQSEIASSAISFIIYGTNLPSSFLPILNLACFYPHQRSIRDAITCLFVTLAQTYTKTVGRGVNDEGAAQYKSTKFGTSARNLLSRTHVHYVVSNPRHFTNNSRCCLCVRCVETWAWSGHAMHIINVQQVRGREQEQGSYTEVPPPT